MDKQDGMVIGRVRSYGYSPFEIAVLHGGPGACGSVSAVARELGRDYGTLEPIQTAMTVDGQIEELREQLESNADLPAVVIGHSWGAMLAFMFTGRHQDMVSKLIMVGSGVFTGEAARQTQEVRLSRIAPEDREEYDRIMAQLSCPTDQREDRPLSRLGEITARCDYYDPVFHEPDPEPLGFMRDVHTSVWADAKELRRTGGMIAMGKSIRCPVVIVHGDYDPHRIEGITDPLASIGIAFSLRMLEKCGHEPWTERHARERFFEILREELA